ncbi:MAG: helix-turn-helix domain-containing protein [Lachnospiraceae bacterium]|nr:helix-turn-helix domain-containing protein [Lachnospiraceae bacterium]
METGESGDRIRNLRKGTGMSRKEFSDYFGIPLRTVEDWEAGRRKPPEYVPRLMEYQIKYEKLKKACEQCHLQKD